MHLVLEDAGYRILEADGVEAARSVWNQYRGRIKLLITDIRLRDSTLDGVVMAQDFQGDDSNLKVIVTTGNAADERGEEIQLPSNFHLLNKPFGIAELLAVTERALVGTAEAD